MKSSLRLALGVPGRREVSPPGQARRPPEPWRRWPRHALHGGMHPWFEAIESGLHPCPPVTAAPFA